MKLRKKIIGAYSAELVGKGDLSRSYLNHADPHARLAALMLGHVGNIKKMLPKVPSDI
jgi:hypothetical protein